MVQTEVLFLGIPIIPALVKAPLRGSLVNLPGNFMPVEVVVEAFIKIKPMELAVLAVEVAAEVRGMGCSLLLAKQTQEAVEAAEVAAHKGLTAMEQTAALASCASGCTRKRNNKLKGERLCTTL